MRRLGLTTAALCALLLGAQAAIAQSPEPLPSPAEPPSAEPLPNADRPLTHAELLAFRGELADPDQLVTVVAETVIERQPARDSEPGPVIGTLARDDRYPGDPAVEASQIVAARYPSDREPIEGLAALYVTDDMRLRGHVATPAGTYLTPIGPEAIAAADALPEGALLAVRGWLSTRSPTPTCPPPRRELEVQRLGGGSPFLDCPAGWLTSEPAPRAADDEPLATDVYGIRVQHGAADHFRQRGEPATYLLRHIANPVEGGSPGLGWEVLARLDPVQIPAVPALLDQASAPTGLEWEPVLERQPPADTNGSGDAASSVHSTAWAGGFASVHQGRDRIASSWVSTDGLAWRSASLPTAIGRVEALLPLRGDLVIVADSSHTIDGDGDWHFTVWRSKDGLTWRRVKRHAVRTPERFAAPYYRIVQGFWSTGDRLVAHETYTTYRCCGDSSAGTTFASAPKDDDKPVTYAWTSVDGRSWKRERVKGLHVADGWHYRNAIHETADGLYALAGHPTYSIDHSRDGVRWQTVGRQPTGLDFYQARIFEPTGDGFVIGGTVEEPQAPGEEWQASTVLWHSPDADRWTETDRPVVGQTLAVASVGDTVVVAGGSPYAVADEDTSSWLMTSTDGGRTWDPALGWATLPSWCLRDLTAAGPGILLDVACAPLDAASRYLATVDLPPEPEPTVAPVSKVRSAREAVQCDVGTGIHTRGLSGGGDEDPRVAMLRMVRSGTVVPVRGYKVLERGEDAVLYGFRNGDEVKVAARVKRDGERWRPDGLSRCPLAEFGPGADMGQGVWLWVDADGRTIQERKGPEHCGWGSMRILYLTERGAPENMRRTMEYVRDPAGDVRDQWQARYLKRTELPQDAVFTGYRRDGAWLWLAADGDAAYVVRGNQVEQWPLVEPGGIGCA